MNLVSMSSDNLVLINDTESTREEVSIAGGDRLHHSTSNDVLVGVWAMGPKPDATNPDADTRCI